MRGRRRCERVSRFLSLPIIFLLRGGRARLLLLRMIMAAMAAHAQLPRKSLAFPLVQWPVVLWDISSLVASNSRGVGSISRSKK
jgi:hypothetical protein